MPKLPQLPFPPTMNTYWRHVGRRVLLSAKARQFRKDVVATIGDGHRRMPYTESLFLTIVFYPPDQRRRDLDNLPKGLLDGLKYAGVYFDDSQVRRIDMKFGPVIKGGRTDVAVDVLGIDDADLDRG